MLIADPVRSTAEAKRRLAQRTGALPATLVCCSMLQDGIVLCSDYSMLYYSMSYYSIEDRLAMIIT